MKTPNKKKNQRKALAFRPFKPCPNCGKDISNGGHFVPPSMGDEGFFVCDNKNAERTCADD